MAADGTMTSFSGNILFSQQPPQKTPWGSFAASYLIQGTAVAFLLTLSVAAPHFVQKRYEHIELVQTKPEQPLRPRATTHKTPPRPAIVLPQRARKLLQMTAPPEPIPAPVIKAPIPALPHPEVARVAQPKYVPQVQQAFEPAPTAKPAPKAAQVQTNVFGSSAQTTLKNRSASQVQTGGFGSPAGFKPNPNSAASHANLAATGAFDLPSGAGNGNGNRGAKGTPGAVASAGFGNGVASPAGGHAPQGHVQGTGFNSFAAAPSRGRITTAGAVNTPVSVQSKPKPVYTTEARELKVQGEVLLEVNFSATGQVHVIRVVRGLGHGLDEAAVRAAQGIHFTPAQREGHAVDSNATLHIVFQLS